MQLFRQSSLMLNLRNSDGTITTKRVKVLSNMAVDITKWVDISKEEARELGVTEAVFFPVLSQILAENESLDEIKEAISKNIGDLIPKHITVEDIIASINYNMHLEYGVGTKDDIDHLGNRRIRAVGELLTEPVQNWYLKNGKSCKRKNVNSGFKRSFTTVTY